MRFGSRVSSMRPWLGVLGVAAVALGISLQLEGAPFDFGRQGVVKSAGGSANVEQAAATVVFPKSDARPAPTVINNGSGKMTVGQMPLHGYEVVSVVRVDYRDDRGTRERAAGTLFGPLPYRNADNQVAACALPACSFDIDCDDGLRCTRDSCAYGTCSVSVGVKCNVAGDCPGAETCNLAGLGQGFCQGSCDNRPVPAGEPGECDDGLFCNGGEVCNAGGACVPGAAPTCCTDIANPTACSENFPRCSIGSANAGAGCLINSDCVGGVCERCQLACASAADCDDGLECNGTESCVAGLCVAGVNPCGAGADCTEGDCTIGTGGTPCNSDADCPVNEGGICRLSELSVCFTGRCCTPDTGIDPDDQMQCSQLRRLNRTVAGVKGCQDATHADGAGLWYSGDTGRDSGAGGDATGLCGGEDPANQANDEWGCPKYSRGIMQVNAATPPVYGTMVGPISDSLACVPTPSGPGNPCATPTMAAGRLHSMGDDYSFTNVGAENHLALDAVRWVGGLVAGNRVSLEFYDSNNNFVEDIVMPPLGAAIGINVVIFSPPLTIPPSGFMVLRVATDFEPNTEIVWRATNGAASVGNNDAGMIWYNGAPQSGAGNFLGAGNGIMAFELVGDKVVTPSGACCDKTTGECADGVLDWICTGAGDVFHGVGSRCAVCNGLNAGQSCRECVGGGTPGAPCLSDNDCSGGSCNTDNANCAGQACTTGQVGAVCTVPTQDADCDIPGSCPSGTCVAGNVGAPCTPGPVGDASCTIQGTCGSAACVALQQCAVGACCSAAGGCTETSSGSCVGTFQGFGTSCDADRGYDPGQQNCCPQPTGQRCMGGPNNYNNCTTDIQCGACVRSTNPGVACDADTDCPDVANGTCTAGFCVGGANPGIACLNNAVCAGSDGVCDGRCVVRGTGGDDCEDAFVHVITVPNQNEPAKVITISGNNSTASSTAGHPDSCFGPVVNPRDEPGWWEAFSVDKCARVRIDMCCSDPVHQPQWAFIVNDCLEGPPSSCGNFTGVGNAVDPYVQGQAQNFRGEPYCPEDNLWQTFGLLPAGTYHHPIFSQLNGIQGSYQIHITVEGCPAAACCYTACSISGTPCSEINPCGGGQGTCNAQCDEFNQLQCDAVGGFYLGPPQVATAVPLCGVGDAACAGGSCCTGPGICQDTRENFGNTMTKAECDTRGGNYVGGVLCKGGRCAAAACLNYSCSIPEDCCSGACNGTVDEKAQANPCPICEIEGPNNCQLFDDVGSGAPSDLSFGTGSVMADDFIHAGGDITTVCVWGGYLDQDPDSTLFDCGARVLSDHFRVRIYSDDNGLPGTALATRTVDMTGPTRPRALIPNAAAMDLPGNPRVETYGFQLTLPTPITGLTPGTCYWLEVANDTGDDPVLCTWHWVRLGNGNPRGNDYSAAGDASAGYVPGAESTWDMTFCLNTNFAGGGCGSTVKACCDCVGACDTSSLRDCGDGDDQYVVHQSTCGGGFVCPPAPSNDNCVNAIPTYVGTNSFTTGCATTDGYGPIPDDGGVNQIVSDLWYTFEVPNNPAIPDEQEKCNLLISMCGTGSTADNSATFDSMVAVYTDPTTFGVCPCPTTQTVSDRTLVASRDENCYKTAVGGAAFVEVADVIPGACYTVRVGGYPGQGNERGTGSVNISCGPTFCGDNRRNGSEFCDGVDLTSLCVGGGNNGLECNQASDCPGGLCQGYACTAACTQGAAISCGDGVITAPAEACDPNCTNCNILPGQLVNGCFAGTTCEADCQCTSFCGNAHVEEGEQCDQTDDAACPGQCTGACTCPVAACGNGILDGGEECDIGFACPQGGNCRANGDLLGGCTCACPGVIDPPAPVITWVGNSPADPEGRPTRDVRVSLAAATASGGAGSSAIRVKMVDLQNPVPSNPPCCPPPNFSTYESATCTAAGETGGCVRWVGPVATIREAQDNLALGTYKAARLQCSPFYRDWTTVGVFAIYGPDIMPSSTYELQSYGEGCKGTEASCTGQSVGPVVTVSTRRSGDVFTPFAPSGTQPDSGDIVAVVNKFRNQPGAPKKFLAQIQPSLIDLNVDTGALDIVATIDAFRGGAYPYVGPCSCPSLVSCAQTCTTSSNCPAGASCLRFCVGGDNNGTPCSSANHCPGGGTCPATGSPNGFCRDRCGRCN